MSNNSYMYLEATKEAESHKCGNFRIIGTYSIESQTGYYRTVNTVPVKRIITQERQIRVGFYDLAVEYQSVHVNY